MRIYLWLAAGVGAIALGSAAAARPGGSAPGGSGPSWSYGGHHAGKGGRPGSGISWGKIDRRPGRHHGGFGRRDFYPYGGAGIAGPVAEVDPHGNGFFNRGGGEIQLRGGRPYYDYDRAYPYEWASSARARDSGRTEAARRTDAPPRCTFENGVRVCRGW